MATSRNILSKKRIGGWLKCLYYVKEKLISCNQNFVSAVPTDGPEYINVATFALYFHNKRYKRFQSM